MGDPKRGPSGRRGAVLAAILLIGGAAVAFLARYLAGPDRADAPAAPTPPSGAGPSNRAVWIEGGTFVSRSEAEGAGDPASPFWTGDEGFGRQTVAGFWMQEHEVTNEEYRRFDPGHEFAAGRERHPAVDVTWREAMAYATSLGGTLPTEVQWEFAARGTESRTYPWGDDAPTCERAHFADCEPRGTIEAMSRPGGATPEGLHGLAGNVWEWVRPNWFEPGRTPVNDASRRLRGGSFRSEGFFLRAVNRNNDFFEGFEQDDVGFRVVWPVEGARD